jgi:hypothetical protein
MAEDIVVSMLDERRQPTLDSVEMLLKAQNAHIDVIHVNFKGNQMTIGTKPVAPGKKFK